MSLQLIDSAWNCELPAGQKLVLLALCSMSNDQRECWPTVAVIGMRCGTAERTTQQHLSALEDKGLIARSTRSGDVSHYTIKLSPK